MSPNVYPLSWPDSWPRNKPEPGRFKATLAGALANLRSELRLLGATNVLISSNVSLGVDNPSDGGVAVYFSYEGQSTCIPCDRWIRVEHNIQAIAKTVEALRGIERWAPSTWSGLPSAATRRCRRPAAGLGGRSWSSTAVARLPARRSKLASSGWLGNAIPTPRTAPTRRWRS